MTRIKTVRERTSVPSQLAQSGQQFSRSFARAA